MNLVSNLYVRTPTRCAWLLLRAAIDPYWQAAHARGYWVLSWSPNRPPFRPLFTR